MAFGSKYKIELYKRGKDNNDDSDLDYDDPQNDPKKYPYVGYLVVISSNKSEDIVHGKTPEDCLKKLETYIK